jgi:hypothetical protein
MKKVLLIMMILMASVYVIGQEVSQAPVLSEEGTPVIVDNSGIGPAINFGNQGDYLAIWAVPSTGGTSGNSRAPSNFFKYQRTEYLVTPAEMAACGFPNGSDIQSIGWLIATAGVGNITGTLTIWLKNTTDATYGLGATWTTSGFTQVHSDASFSVPITAGYYNVTFNGGTPFTYTGGGVYVAWEFNSPTGTIGTAGNVAYCNTNATNSLYGNRSNTALPTTLAVSSFRPATTFGNNGLVDIIAINNVYALGQVATPFANPTDIRVSVANGSASSSTFDLTVTVKDSLTGTVRYTSTQTGLTLAANSSNIFTFTGWSPTLLEKVIITAEAPAAPGENFIFNNSTSAKALVNNSVLSHNYNIVNPGAWGFNTPPRIFLAKYKMSASGVVSSANILIGNSTDNIGDVVYAVVLNSAGTIIAQSANDTLTAGELGVYKNYTFPSPPSFCNEEFFIGLAQTGVGYPMGAMSENPVRPNTFYSCDISGGILNMSTSAKYCLDAVVTSFTGVCNPTNLTATAVSGNQLNLAWTQNLSGDPVMLVYNTTNSFGAPVNGTVYTAGNVLPGGGTVIYRGAGTTFPHTGLTPSTTYYYRAYSYDGSNNYSTPTAASGATYFGVTYFQNFDAGTTLPAGWSGIMAVEATHGTSATNGLTYNLYDGDPSCQGISPFVTLSGNPCRLIFDYRLVDWASYPATATTLGPNDKIEVQISTNGGTTWTTIYTINSATHTTSMSFATKTFDLTAYTAQTIKVRFLGTWGSGDYYIDIDNFLLEEMPLCTTPSTLTVTNITTTSAVIGWPTPTLSKSITVRWVMQQVPGPSFLRLSTTLIRFPGC